MQRNTLVKSGATVATAATLALAGTALANADQSPTPTPSQSPAATPTPGQPGAKDAGKDHAADRAAHDARLLSGTTALEVIRAATAKEPTAKLERVGAEPAGGYTARMVRTDGTHIVLHIDPSFTVTSAETAPPPAHPAPHTARAAPKGPDNRVSRLGRFPRPREPSRANPRSRSNRARRRRLHPVRRAANRRRLLRGRRAAS